MEKKEEWRKSRRWDESEMLRTGGGCIKEGRKGRESEVSAKECLGVKKKGE